VIRRLLGLGILASAAAATVGLVLMFAGPRMDDQVNVRSYRAAALPVPAGSVPLQTGWVHPTDGPCSPPPGESAMAAGFRGYSYYCVFCHGDRGDGDGPVGQSYVPKPADLRSERVQSLSDEQLARAMVAGTGHAPVLERVVPPEVRQDIARYVRGLAAPTAQDRAE